MSKKSLQFHVENNDYFGTLATVLSMFRQNRGSKYYKEDDDKILKLIEKELLILQKEYKIIKK